ncbi:MAG: zinc metalloprotease [Bacteroidetes bacterium]|nr:zinc metalloprotease [Bacteroidota bacterium]
MKNLILAVLILIPNLAVSQHQPRTCFTPYMVDKALKADPVLAARRESMKTLLKNELQRSSMKRTSGVQRVQIPVVVHIVLNPDSPGQSVTDEQVYSQIRVLNEDYRKKPGTNGYSDHPASADTQLEFKLATIAPNGQPTTGINRINVTETSFDPDFDDEQLKSYSYWDATKYLNIWVANLTGGILGYAYYPGSAPDGQDGVVILYTAFGTTGSARSPFNLGRTATHEVGHYLDLIHTWGDDNSCFGTDEVEDTPPCSGQYFSGNNNAACSFPAQCFGTPRQTENYMDYSDDRCMNLFTQGQSDRMNTALTLFRAGLLKLPGVSQSIGVDYIDYPSLFTGGTYAFTVTVRNNGSASVTGGKLHYRVPDEGIADSLALTGSLSSGGSKKVVVNLQFQTGGVKAVKMWTSVSTDQFAGDDTASVLVPVEKNRPEVVADFDLYSDYQTPDVIQIGWKMPLKTVNGVSISSPMSAILFRDGEAFIRLDNLSAGEALQYRDSGLVQYNSYSYSVGTLVSGIPDTSTLVTGDFRSGGSPIPDSPADLSARTNGSIGHLTFRLPMAHDDGTPLHNPLHYVIYRIPGGYLDSSLFSIDDLNGVVTVFDIPIGKGARNYRYSVLATGLAPFYARSTESNSVVIRTGAFSTVPFTDAVSSGKSVFLGDSLWQVTTETANPANGILQFSGHPGSSDTWLISPMIRLSGKNTVTYRTQVLEGNGLAGTLSWSTNYGKTWTVLDSVKSSDLPAWEQNQASWMTRAVQFTTVSDTVVIRFEGAMNHPGLSWLIDDVKITSGGVSVDEPVGTTQGFKLGQNYPNPFNPESRISLTLPEGMVVSTRLLDVLGREVNREPGVFLPAGDHVLVIRAGHLSSGLYLYEVTAGNFRQTRLIQLVR